MTRMQESQVDHGNHSAVFINVAILVLIITGIVIMSGITIEIALLGLKLLLW